MRRITNEDNNKQQNTRIFNNHPKHIINENDNNYSEEKLKTPSNRKLYAFIVFLVALVIVCVMVVGILLKNSQPKDNIENPSLANVNSNEEIFNEDSVEDMIENGTDIDGQILELLGNIPEELLPEGWNNMTFEEQYAWYVENQEFIDGIADNPEKQEELKAALEPLNLIDLNQPYDIYAGEIYNGTGEFSIGGQLYSQGFVMKDGIFVKYNPGANYDDSYAIINLDGMADTLTFSVGHIDGTEQIDRKMSVYVDDNAVVDSEVVPYDILSKDYTINVNGAKAVKIIMECTKQLREHSEYGFFNLMVVPNPYYSAANEVKGILLMDENPPYDSKYCEFVGTGERFEEVLMGGKLYADGIILYGEISGVNDKAPAVVLFNLNSSYKKITFDIGNLPEHEFMKKYHPMERELTITLDGKVMNQIIVKPDELPQTVEIPVEGVNGLKLELSQGENTFLRSYSFIGNIRGE